MAAKHEREGPDRVASVLFGILSAVSLVGGSIVAAQMETQRGLGFALSFFVGLVLAGLAALAYSVEEVRFQSQLKSTRPAEPTNGEQPTNPGWDSTWRAHDRQEGSG